ncbi:cupin domain-containing protein [Maricaulis salignorans]|uniref:Cupin superfamily protein n=1 Tax=Maricaulis salignorans TaxID=144026 RepID=A0A1G9UPC7_9PROT|nr:cupin domain-containing protein [Maricaulis salignorans]SDM61761.1 Cupin superfamily protein [Maricaulis salignorans]
MSDQQWMQDVLGYLLDPMKPEEFLADYHEKKAFIAHRKDPERYRPLLSIQRIDDLISGMDFQPGMLDMARSDPPISRPDYSFESGMIDRGAVARNFQQGATIVLPQLHQVDPTLAGFTRSIESLLSCHVQTNIYLTPPEAQGFKTHYDDHDVFVLQVEGSKSWRLYDTPVQNPYRGEGFQPGAHEVGEPVQEFVLHAGECAYVPRGLMHDASTHGHDVSLHITVGLIVKTWADLMLEVVSDVALRRPEFRHALPVGFARPDFDRTQSAIHFKTLMAAINSEADLDSSYDIFVDNFIRSRTPNTHGTIVNLDTPNKAGQRYRLRPLVPWRLAEDGDEVVIITAGGEVRFPAAAEPGLHILLDGGEISESSFADLDEDQRRETVKKLFAFGLCTPAE